MVARRDPPVDEGFTATHNGRLTIALGRGPDGWKVIVALLPDHAIPAGDFVTADFDADDVQSIVDALLAAVADARKAARKALP